MKDGALRGLSIGYGYYDYKSDVESRDGLNYLKRINLFEISPVVFAANVEAQVIGAKAFEEATTKREFEAALREAGLSKSVALYIVSRCEFPLRDSKVLRIYQKINPFL